ncbi:MAG: hypothetical protein LBF24_00600 [Puniceicoccales bacterium]|jgi:hypothetical protein|nr:hypothetical protein [Puniceicoccales bacterium]
MALELPLFLAPLFCLWHCHLRRNFLRLGISLIFPVVLLGAVRSNFGAPFFLLSAALLSILSGKNSSAVFALAVQTVGLLSLLYFPNARWAVSLHTIGLLGCAEFFPLCATKKPTDRRTVLLSLFCHGAYLYALLLRTPVVDYRTVIVLASLSVPWGTLSAFGERSLWRQWAAIFHVSLAATFALFLFLPNLRANGARCLLSLLISASLMATLLPGDGPIYEQDLKGLLAQNPVRATLLAITVLLICLFPAIPLLAYCLPALTALRLAPPVWAICLCLAVSLSMAVRMAVVLSLFSERPGVPTLCRKIDPPALSFCLLQLIFALLLALSGMLLPTG